MLANLKGVRVPRYDRTRLKTGLVHLGVGNFHRAHQAQYTEAVLEAGDLRWGTLGASLRSRRMRNALEPQEFLYTVCTRDEAQVELRLAGGLKNIFTQQDRMIAAIANPDVQVVTLTISEKGYANPDVASVLSQALTRRMEQRAPVTILSCDNVSANGEVLKSLIKAHCDGAWLDELVAFPCSMVDRITPAVNEADKAHIESMTGYFDAAPVVCESYSQWVIEDDFRGQRPEWELGGAELVKDVAPYEQAKLRLLNASHSILAYLGLLKGYEFVHDALADHEIGAFLRHTLDQEIKPNVDVPAGMQVDAYAGSILRRFASSAVPYRTAQVASDGAIKLRERIFPTLQRIWAERGEAPGLELVLCAWRLTRADTRIDFHDAEVDWSDVPREALARLDRTYRDLAQEGISTHLARRPRSESPK